MSKIENLDEIIKKLKEHEKRIIILEESILKPSAKEDLIKKISIREFLNSKKPKGAVNNTLAIGYFIENYENLEFFNKSDLLEYFKKAKEIPQKINDKVYKNIKKGYIMEVDERKDNLKCWCLTNSGLKFCENDFKKE